VDPKDTAVKKGFFWAVGGAHLTASGRTADCRHQQEIGLTGYDPWSHIQKFSLCSWREDRQPS